MTMHIVCELCGNYGCSCWEDRKALIAVMSGWTMGDLLYETGELSDKGKNRVFAHEQSGVVRSKGAIQRGRFPQAYFEGWTTHKAAPANKIETELLNLVDAEAHQVTLG
jgi:hypothetical protein